MSESSASVRSFPPVGTPEFWAEYMALYDEGVGTLFPYRELVAEVAGQALLAAAPITVLDAGCGTGNVGVRLAESSRVMRYIGVDQNRSAIDIAREKLRGPHRCIQLDATLHTVNLDEDWVEHPRPLGKAGIDVVVCTNVLYTLAAPDRFINRVASLLRSGGRLVLSNPYRTEPEVILRAHQQWLIERSTPEQFREDEVRGPMRRDFLAANRLIAAASKRHEQHFLSPDELTVLLGRNRLRPIYTNPEAYAGTNVTIAAVRE